MKLDRLFKFGKQGYNMYRSYRGKSQGRTSYGGGSSYNSKHQGGGTLERLIRRFLK